MTNALRSLFTYFAADGTGIEAEIIQATGLARPVERFNLILALIFWAAILAALLIGRRKLQ